MSAPQSVIVVGYGRMGRLHARTLRAMPEFRLLGVVEPDPHRAEEAARDGMRCVPLLERIGEKPALAIVAVPTHRHAQVACALLMQGVHCLVEKPAGGDAGDVASMIAAADVARVRVFAAYSERFNPVVAALRARTERPAAISVVRRSAHALQAPRDSDAIRDLLAHDVDWTCALADAALESVAVHAMRLHRGKVEDVCCTLSFANGLIVELASGRIAEDAERAVVATCLRGRRETFALDAPRAADDDDALTGQARAFARAVAGEATPLATLDDAFRTHRILDRVALAAADMAGAHAA